MKSHPVKCPQTLEEKLWEYLEHVFLYRSHTPSSFLSDASGIV